MSSELKNKFKGNIEESADFVLRICNVKPSSHSNFLRAGGGKLVSNPEETVKDTYIKLRKFINSI